VVERHVAVLAQELVGVAGLVEKRQHDLESILRNRFGRNFRIKPNLCQI
jgi:hypothetical protein